jgi:hypothetical protein
MRTAGFLIAGRSGTATPGLFRFLRRVISSGHHAEAHTKSVPGVDGANYKRQIYKFFIIEVWPGFFKHGIRDMVAGNECQRLDSGQGRLLTGREESGFRQS